MPIVKDLSTVERNVLILTSSPRSGSSLLADLLSSAENSALFFEPLRYLDWYVKKYRNTLMETKTASPTFDKFAADHIRPEVYERNINRKTLTNILVLLKRLATW